MIITKNKEFINKNVPVPRYRQLAERIRTHISSKKLPPGTNLWSERHLMKRHEISLATVRKAYEVLEQEGVIIKEHGRGVFVANKKHEKVKLKVLFDRMILPEKIWKKIVIEFNKKNPHIEINGIFVDGKKVWKDHIEQFKPDIYCLDESFWHVLKDRDLLLDISTFVKQDKKEFTGIYQNLFESFMDKNAVYAIPYRFSTFALFYNKEMLRQQNVSLPEDMNWETFLDIAKKMTVHRSNGTIKHYGFMLNPGINHLAIFCQQNGGEICPFNIENSFGSPKVKEAIKFWYYDMLHKHKVTPDSERINAFQLFTQRKITMFIERYYSVSMLDKKSDFEWGIAPLPVGHKRACSLPAQGLAIAKDTKSLASAWKFIKFAVSAEIQRSFSHEGAGLPSQSSVAEELPHSKVFIDELQYARPAWPYAFNEARNIIKDELSIMRLNLQNADVACNKIARKCEKLTVSI